MDPSPKNKQNNKINILIFYPHQKLNFRNFPPQTKNWKKNYSIRSILRIGRKIQCLPSVILSFRIFKTLSIPSRKSWGPEILRECSTQPCATCHVSHVKCQMWGVRCQVFFLQCGGATWGGGSVIHGAYTVYFFISRLNKSLFNSWPQSRFSH